MSAPFVAEIRIFAGNFAPSGWALCDGQLIPINQNTALFSLLGTFYGGDGKSTFALPNLQGSAALSQGQSTTGSQFFLGQQSGAPTVALLQTEMPLHSHQPRGADVAGTTGDPSNAMWAKPGSGRGRPAVNGYDPQLGNAQTSFTALSVAGSSSPHNNMSPYVALTFIIALQGDFPPRP